MKRSLIALIAVSLLLGNSYAQIINVPGEYETIQEAIESTNEGDTVVVAENTYFENLNFMGKAITVGSLFLLDGDTSHISRTIIDGSQATSPDTASVVTMWSGEDTTSVLCGFTLTGGLGTRLPDYPVEDWNPRSGGAVLIMNSGGKIVNNIIQGIELEESYRIFGAGICATVSNFHSAIIRNNLIRNNSARSITIGTWGGGLFLSGGRIILEGNTIAGNTTTAAGYSAGTGVYYWTGESEGEVELEGIIEEVIFRNNIIYGNKAYSEREESALGGGMTVNYGFEEQRIQIYNNLIYDNYSDDFGGGFHTLGSSFALYNNTIINNQAGIDGSSIHINEANDIIMYNNISWSEIDTVSDIWFSPEENTITACYNVMKEPLKLLGDIDEYANTYMEPGLDQDTYRQTDSSPVIGRGIDSVMIGEVWYYAPEKDLGGEERPGTVDSFVDPGAYESLFSRSISANADLMYLDMEYHELDPAFHKDSLDYMLVKKIPTAFPVELLAAPVDGAAVMETDPATDYDSENDSDRTSTFTVTSSDGSVQKEYRVMYKYYSSDAFLSAMEVSLGTLDPAFDRDIFSYVDTLPFGTRKVPSVSYTPSDTNATVIVLEAADLRSRFAVVRTTTVKISSENRQIINEYKVVFTVVNSRPVITLESDTVEQSGSIRVTSDASGHIYLVPKDTEAEYDSLIAHMIISVEAGAGVMSYIPAAELESDLYWLFAVDRYRSISQAVEVRIIGNTGDQDIFEDQLRIYPVPVENILYIDTEKDLAGLELYNSAGARIWEGSGENRTIRMAHLAPGSYYLKIRFSEGQTFITGLIKK